ncbi:MAG TPA: hypothetical protein VGN37_04305 [Actinocatenispora sp.]
MTPDAVRELYQAPIEEFVATRDRLVRAARGAGDTELAEALAAARKPVLAAWLVNRLAAAAPDRVGGLLELADRFRAAYAAGDAGRVRDLSTERQRALADLVDLAAEYAGRRVTDAVLAQVGETLSAALVEPDVAARVRDGVLVRPERYSGLGLAMPAPRAAPDRTAAKTRTKRTGETRRTEGAKGKAAEKGKPGPEAGRRSRAERVAEAERARDEAAERERAARGRLDELDAMLAELRDSLREAMRTRDRCARDHESARRALTRAEQRLRGL